MIDLVFSLLGYFVKYIETKEGNLNEYYEVYVKPAYETSQQVFSDYINLLHAVKNMLQQGAKKSEVIDFLEAGRLKYLASRWQLYADVRSRWNDDDLRKLPKFEKGLMGILMGGLSTFDTGRKYYTPYRRGHTLLDIMQWLDDEDRFNKESRAHNISDVEEQITALERAWQDVTEGYAEYKLLVIEKPARTRKLRFDKYESDSE